MAELLSIEADLISGAKVEPGTELRVFSSGGKLVAKADGVPVARISSRYEQDLRGEREKRFVAEASIGDTLVISLLVPEIRVKYRCSIYGKGGAYRLIGDEISHLPGGGSSWETRPTDGVSATVETVSELRRRVTAPRLFALGVYALAMQKEDGGERILTVEGPDFAWTIEIDREKAAEASSFAAKVNAASREFRSSRFVGLEGLADMDGRTHAAVLRTAVQPTCGEAGIDMEMTAALEGELSRMADAGYEITSVKPVGIVGDSMLSVVSYR